MSHLNTHACNIVLILIHSSCLRSDSVQCASSWCRHDLSKSWYVLQLLIKNILICFKQFILIGLIGIYHIYCTDLSAYFVLNIVFVLQMFGHSIMHFNKCSKNSFNIVSVY